MGVQEIYTPIVRSDWSEFTTMVQIYMYSYVCPCHDQCQFIEAGRTGRVHYGKFLCVVELGCKRYMAEFLFNFCVLLNT